MIGIYKIENTINGKCYIGQSENITRRWRAHRSAAFNPNAHNYDITLYRAIRKYGIDNFTFTVLVECELSELNELESKFIQEYNSIAPNGYNLSAGGTDAVCYSKITEKEVLEIIDLLQNSAKTQEDIAIQFNISQKMVSNINTGNSWIRQGLEYPIRKRKTTYFCEICGIEIATNSKHCTACADKLRQKIDRPSREELKVLIRKNTFVSIGEKYGVSDNAVRKWCAAYNLPTKKSIIKTYSDKEWEEL